ncbi:MAG: Ig-like domain-containing protein [Oscillospiraceae bacterium]|nr:Ig-like domain-containing protein [Oscillospiraceae bacterium]
MKKLATLSAVIVLILSLGTAALADGDGDGSGGGSGEPLMLAGSSVADGSTGISTDVYITLTFSKNVVNFTVKDNNAACISLTDSAGGTVPVSVVMGDDQVDPGIKRIIGVQTSGLKEGETYTLNISGALTSKSGVSLGSPIAISFTTAEAAVAEPDEPVSSEDTPEDAEEMTGEGEDILLITSAEGVDAELVIAPAPEAPADNTLWIVNGVCAAVLLAAYLATRKNIHN